MTWIHSKSYNQEEPVRLKKQYKLYRAKGEKRLTTYCIYFKSRPTKSYFIACEMAKRAYEHEIIPNEFEDDESVNHKVMFTEDKQKKWTY